MLLEQSGRVRESVFPYCPKTSKLTAPKSADQTMTPRMTTGSWADRSSSARILATSSARKVELPFVMDSSSTQALLGLAPTPLAAAADETVRWWQGEHAAARR